MTNGAHDRRTYAARISESGARGAEPLVRTILKEFLEMPGLRLTLKQAQRLWSLDSATCASALERLVNSRLISCGTDGRYERSLAIHRPGIAKAFPPQLRAGGRRLAPRRSGTGGK